MSRNRRETHIDPESVHYAKLAALGFVALWVVILTGGAGLLVQSW